MGTGSITRGCGKRVKGGIYAEVPTSDHGVPVEWFLIDPPQVIVPDEIGLTPIGVLPIEREGVTHVFDWIGSESYPNVADFIEEARRFGVSRRLPSTFDFSTLTKDSRLVFVHAKAWIEDPAGLFLDQCLGLLQEDEVLCPKVEAGLESPHKVQGEECLGLSWFDLTLPKDEQPEDLGPFGFERAMPWGSYPGVWIPGKRSHRPAIFASFPLQQLTVIRDPEEGTHEAALDKVLAGRPENIPVVVEDE